MSDIYTQYLRIHHFKLGSRLRRINQQVLYSLSTRLKTFDLSEMTSDSRCYLIDFIKHSYRSMNIIFPRIEYSNECDCEKLILYEIQSMKTSKDSSICSKQCRFSDCLVISEYFREKSPLLIDENRINEGLPSVDLFADPIDVDMMSYLINQTNDIRRSTTPSIPLTMMEDFYLIDQENNPIRKSFRFSWIPFSIGIVVIVLLSIILLFLVKHKNHSHLKGVPVYV
jgi:hypothetical protein